MKQTLRLNTFETNSSSVHALAVSNDAAGRNGIDLSALSLEIIPDGEFGWGYEVLDDITDKLKYIYQVAIERDDNEAIEKLKQLLPNCAFIGNANDGYVDHGYEKESILDYALGNLEEFINSCVIILANDNSDFREYFESVEKDYDAKIIRED